MNATTTNATKHSAIITCDNCHELARMTALVALTTIHKNSGNKHITDLLNAIIFDDDSKAEGADIVSALKVCYYQLVGSDLFNTTMPNNVVISDGNGYTMLAISKKDKQPLTIWRSALRFVNTIVFTNKRELKKTVYLEEIDDDGTILGYTQIPMGFDCDSLDEHDWYDYVVSQLELTTTQKKVLKALYWKVSTACDSLADTARKAGTSKQNVLKVRRTLQAKYCDKYKNIASYEMFLYADTVGLATMQSIVDNNDYCCLPTPPTAK